MSNIRLDETSQEYRDAINHIYGLAHNVCINGLEQKALLKALGEREKEGINSGETGQDTVRGMLNIIHDGLSYGNWPWIKNAVNTLEKEN